MYLRESGRQYKSSSKLNIELPYELPAILLLGIYPKYLKQGLIYLHTNVNSSIIHSSWKGGNYLMSISINKMWHIYTKEY